MIESSSEGDVKASRLETDSQSGRTNAGSAQDTDGPAASNTATDEYIYETTLNDWDIRMNLPAEWRDCCGIDRYEYDSRDYVRFLYKDSMDSYGGHVFSLTTVKGTVDLEDVESGEWRVDTMMQELKSQWRRAARISFS